MGFIEWKQYCDGLVSIGAIDFDSPQYAFIQPIVMDQESIPISAINRVTDRGNYNQVYKRKFMLLCEKYVGSSAPYQLNLPYWLSKECHEIVHALAAQASDRGAGAASASGGNSRSRSTVSGDEELRMLETATRLSVAIIKETISLIKDSLSRFKNDPMFSRFKFIES